ncbi:hypothetical protein [Ornithinimicrobium kibberense]
MVTAHLGRTTADAAPDRRRRPPDLRGPSSRRGQRPGRVSRRALT